MILVTFNLVYFTTETWGSVSDWVMIIVTIITIYFLSRTLSSQLKVQELQIKLFQMERVRLSEELRPKLEYSILSMEITPNKKATLVSIRVGNVGTKTARNIVIKATENSRAAVFFGLEEDEHYPEMLRPNPRHRTIEPGFRKSISFILSHEQNEFPNFVTEFTVQYEDAMKNGYFDWIRCIPIENKIIIKVFKSEPEMFDSRSL